MWVSAVMILYVAKLPNQLSFISRHSRRPFVPIKNNSHGKYSGTSTGNADILQRRGETVQPDNLP